MWAEIDLGAISHNIALIRRTCRPADQAARPRQGECVRTWRRSRRPASRNAGGRGRARPTSMIRIAIRRAGATCRSCSTARSCRPATATCWSTTSRPPCTSRSTSSSRFPDALPVADQRARQGRCRNGASGVSSRRGGRLRPRRDAGAERASGRDLHAHPVLGCHWPGVVAQRRLAAFIDVVRAIE